MKSIKIKTVIGIDQTGAALRNGKEAKALPVVLAFLQKRRWKFITCFENKRISLKAFNFLELKSLFQHMALPFEPETTAIVVDCVLGLPRSVTHSRTKLDMWKLFFQASRFQSPHGNYGRKTAEEFFEKIGTQKEEGFPKRLCEEWSKSNSVFQSRPFQKNIQTGTFRFWKEMGQDGKAWARIWPYDLQRVSLGTSPGPWLFEGYPTLVWRKYLESQHRNPKHLRRKATHQLRGFDIDTWKIVENFPDHADAFVLAWGAAYLDKLDRLWCPFSGFVEEMEKLQEGWILGLDRPIGI